MKRTLLVGAETLDDFRAIVRMRDAGAQVFTADEIADAGQRFVEFCDSEAQRAVDEEDAEELESLAYSLKHLATALGVGNEVRRGQ